MIVCQRLLPLFNISDAPLIGNRQLEGVKMLEMFGAMRPDNNHTAVGSSSLHRNVFLRPSLAGSMHCRTSIHGKTREKERGRNAICQMEEEEKPSDFCYEGHGE